MTSKLISIVSPVHNEAEIIGDFISRVSDAMKNSNWELVLVDDGSTDNSYELMADIAKTNQHLKLIKLSRNFGHQPAISCGIENAVGEAVVVLDSDLQDPPEVVLKFIEKWQEGFDVVYGQRNSRAGESFFKRVTAAGFYRLLNRLSDTKFPVDTGDFRLMDRKVVEAVKLMNEKNRYLRGMVAWVGFNQVAVQYDREPRARGKTKFSLLKMINFATDGLFSFSNKPLRLANLLSLFFALSTVILAIYILFQKIKYPDQSLPGFVPTIVLVSFIASIQFLVLAILGSYIGRIYKEVKNRPIYIQED
jgi:glycosyltransferase involved in cell wall biosynthesis